MIWRYCYILILLSPLYCSAAQGNQKNLGLSQSTNFLDQRFRDRYFMAYTNIGCIYRMYLFDTSLPKSIRTANAQIIESVLKNFDRFEKTPAKETFEKMHHVFAGDLKTEFAQLQKEFNELSEEHFIHKHKSTILEIDPNLKDAYETLAKQQSKVTGKK